VPGWPVDATERRFWDGLVWPAAVVFCAGGDGSFQTPAPLSKPDALDADRPTYRYQSPGDAKTTSRAGRKVVEARATTCRRSRAIADAHFAREPVAAQRQGFHDEHTALVAVNDRHVLDAGADIDQRELEA
jgi:hypothetical protein